MKLLHSILTIRTDLTIVFALMPTWYWPDRKFLVECLRCQKSANHDPIVHRQYQQRTGWTRAHRVRKAWNLFLKLDLISVSAFLWSRRWLVFPISSGKLSLQQYHPPLLSIYVEVATHFANTIELTSTTWTIPFSEELTLNDIFPIAPSMPHQSNRKGSRASTGVAPRFRARFAKARVSGIGATGSLVVALPTGIRHTMAATRREQHIETEPKPSHGHIPPYNYIRRPDIRVCTP